MRKLPPATNPILDRDALAAVLAPRAKFDSQSELVRRLVAVATPSPELMAAVNAARGPIAFLVAGPDACPHADVVLLLAAPDVAATIARLRTLAKPNAAIVCILPRDDQALAQAAHAAGAFACIRAPFGSGELGGLLHSALDATAAKVRAAVLSKEMDLQSHLAAIGRMSAGLTHEINNPLAVAIMAEEHLGGELERLAKGEKVDPGDLLEAFSDLQASHKRIQALVGNLKLLVGHDQVRVEPVDLLDVVRDVRRWADLGALEIEQEGSPAVVSAEPMLLRQIVLNFATNAALAAASLPSARVRFHVYTTPTHGVISVRDNGPGIPAEMQDKIFDPFFTTRRGRGGTGLGLSLCREFARKMGAEISFWSAVNRGACFRVHVPLAPQRSTS